MSGITICPWCESEISETATLCRHCGKNPREFSFLRRRDAWGMSRGAAIIVQIICFLVLIFLFKACWFL